MVAVAGLTVRMTPLSSIMMTAPAAVCSAASSMCAPNGLNAFSSAIHCLPRCKYPPGGDTATQKDQHKDRVKLTERGVPASVYHDSDAGSQERRFCQWRDEL